MIRPPSAQRPWDAFVTSSTEGAIVRPPAAPSDGATPEEVEAFKVAFEEWASKIRAARDTGDWSPVIVANEQPTRFTLDQLDPEAWRELQARAQLPADCDRRIEYAVLLMLLFRLAIRSISGWDKIEREPDPNWNNWMMAPRRLVAQLDTLDKSIVGEIGALVLDRLAGGRPLS